MRQISIIDAFARVDQGDARIAADILAGYESAARAAGRLEEAAKLATRIQRLRVVGNRDADYRTRLSAYSDYLTEQVENGTLAGIELID